MEIVLLDDPVYLTQPLLERLSAMGRVIVYSDHPNHNEAVTRLNEADVAVVRWTPLPREILVDVKRLKYIVLAGTGFPPVDRAAARERRILVSNVPDYCRYSVAEHVFALLLAVNRRIIAANQTARTGKQSPHPEFIGTELCGKTLGVVGLGRIGSWVAKIGMGFGMKTLGYTRSPKGLPGVEEIDLETLLKESDVVSVNVDLNPTTEGLLSRAKLQLMKSSAFLICTTNTAVLDEDALFELLSNRRLAGAGLDSSCSTRKLRELENIVLTPGAAWYTKEALRRIGETIVSNIEHFVRGEPRNLVN